MSLPLPESEGEGDGQQRSLSPFIRRCTAVACLGGVLFGYDLGVISGALPSLTSTLELTDSESETVVAFLFIGSVIGSFVGGLICDRLGRKTSILVCDGIFLLGSIVLSLAPNYGTVLFGRIVVGTAVAVSAIADVSYLTEIAPEHHRGALVSCNEACISLGFLMAYISSYLVTVSINYDQGWRIMFGLSGLIAILQFVLMRGLPESPIWLAEKGRVDESRAAFKMIQADGAESVRDAAVDGEDSSSDFADPAHHAVMGCGGDGDEFGPLPTNEDDSDAEVIKPVAHPEGSASSRRASRISLAHYWRHISIALFLAISQQICGHINILNFAPEIFSEVFGSATSSSLLATTIILGLLKFLLTTFVILEVDKIGRRFLLLSGIGIITTSLLFLTMAYVLGSEEASQFTRSQRALAVLGCSGVVAGYALSYAPLTWLIVSEVFPSSIRGRALGMTTITSNAFAALISYTFLTGQDMFGPAMPFALYFVFSLGSWVFATIAVPDTGEVVAGGNGEDVDEVLDSMLLWRLPCCSGSTCISEWCFRKRGSVKISLSDSNVKDNTTESQDIVPPAIT